MKKLSRKFFEKPTLEVAKSLIGKIMVFGNKKGIITEAEGYFGTDQASHGARSKTKRNFPMFGPAGHSYVYFIYGMYHCFNITTEKEDFPAAVLIRGIKTFGGEEYDGPGKLCNYFGLTREYNNLDLCKERKFFIADKGLKLKSKATPRIGIKKNTEKPWRFVAI